MTVAELIEVLKGMPQNALVAYQCYSEQVLMKAEQPKLWKACPPRPDGWVHDARPDVSTQEYVLFPGN